MPDIDIDFVDREKALKHFKHIRASRVDDGKLVKHNTGVYMHEVPVNAELNLCSVPHKEAEDQGHQGATCCCQGERTPSCIGRRGNQGVPGV